MSSEMKELKLSTVSDFSECAIEAAAIMMRNHHHRELFSLDLTVSVFDSKQAIEMMIDQKYFRYIRYVHITPEFREGEAQLRDDLNDVYVKFGVE